MRIILFGIPEFGIICLQTLLAAGKNVVAFALPPINHPAQPSMKNYVDNAKMPAIVVGKKMRDPQLIKTIKNYKPDLIIIASYSRLIPPEIYNIPKYGTINSHPSLLPQYRGANPYFHVINDGVKETGITFHYVDNSFDTGDIIYQWRIPLSPDETIGTLFVRLSVQSSKFYVDIINQLEKGEALPRIQQPQGIENLKVATEVNLESPILKINWENQPSAIERLVRACNPFFGAYTFYRGLQLKIMSGYYDEKPFIKSAHKPGTIIKVSKDSLAIAAGSGIFYPTCVHFGLLYLTDIKDFIKRNNPKVGEVLN